MINYNFSGKTLSVNGNHISFAYDIKNAINVDDNVIIMLWNLSTGDIQQQPFNNVYVVDGSGKILWNLKDIVGKDGLYTIISINESNKLVAVEFIGTRYIIDVRNRKVIEGQAYK